MGNESTGWSATELVSRLRRFKLNTEARRHGFLAKR